MKITCHLVTFILILASDHYDKPSKCIENYDKSKKANNYLENKNKINKATN